MTNSQRSGMKKNTTSLYVIIGPAVTLVGVSLLLFAVFLYAGSLNTVAFGLNEARTLLLDTVLCLFFFIQHSCTVRKSFQRWLEDFLPTHYHGVFHAVSSGLCLLILIIFWQETTRTAVIFEGVARLLPRLTYFTAIAGLIWSARSLDSFDIAGRGRLIAHMYNRQLPVMPFTISGPYRYVRHPFYFFMLLMIWSCPDVTLDRLLLNILWTIWIVMGTVREELDLAVSFGENYRNYQEQVPMLFPWSLVYICKDAFKLR